jgi:hypothetical protein
MLALTCSLCFGANQTAPMAPPTNPTEPLGRLFFNQAERDELDRIRVGIADSADPTENRRTVHLDGMLRRNGNTPILWVNGRQYKGKDIAGAILNPLALDASTVVASLPPPDPRDVRLKVGQTLDPAGGNLREVYQRPPQELNLLLQMLGKRGATPEKAKAAAPGDGQRKLAKPAAPNTGTR